MPTQNSLYSKRNDIILNNHTYIIMYHPIQSDHFHMDYNLPAIIFNNENNSLEMEGNSKRKGDRTNNLSILVCSSPKKIFLSQRFYFENFKGFFRDIKSLYQILSDDKNMNEKMKRKWECMQSANFVISK